MQAYIGLGSNLNNPKQQISTALDSLSRLPDINVIKISSLYQSKPIDNSKQPDYINAVCQINTKLSAFTLLKMCQNIEDNQQRARLKKWGPRTIDLDILLYGKKNIKTKNLIIPHKEMQYRVFVLLPLAEIAPNLTIPKIGNIATLLTKLHNVAISKL